MSGGSAHGILGAMTIATWILAIPTAAIAAEGGTAVWKFVRVRPGRTRRELDEMHRQITLLQHAAWMDVARENQGTAADGDEKVRAMLMLDGWRPDMDLAEQAGYFRLDRLRDEVPGITDL